MFFLIIILQVSETIYWECLTEILVCVAGENGEGAGRLKKREEEVPSPSPSVRALPLLLR